MLDEILIFMGLFVEEWIESFFKFSFSKLASRPFYFSDFDSSVEAVSHIFRFLEVMVLRWASNLKYHLFFWWYVIKA